MTRSLAFLIILISAAGCAQKKSRNDEPYVHYFLFKESATTTCQSILAAEWPKLIGDDEGALLEEKKLTLPSGMPGTTYEYKNGLLLGKFSNLDDCNQYKKLYSVNQEY